MRTIGLVARKGGVGKSTLSIHLAQKAMEAGEVVVLIDMDPQGSSFAWHQKRSEREELSSVSVIRVKPDKLSATLQQLEKRGASMVFIDTRPDLEKGTQAVCELSDLVVIPTGPAVIDLEAVQHSAKIAKDKGTPWRLVFNKAQAHLNNYKAARERFSKLNTRIAPDPVGKRVIYSDSVGMGNVAWEGKTKANKKAREEMESLWSWLQTELKEGSEDDKERFDGNG